SASLSSKLLPRKSFATITPFLSTMIVLGIDVTLRIFSNGSSQPFKLDNCNQVNRSFSIAFTHLSLLSSNEIPMIFNPRSLYLLYIVTTCGFSFRHGAHQDAQKSMMVYFPRFFLSDWGLLWTSLSVKSSNLAPITTNSYSFKKVANF